MNDARRAAWTEAALAATVVAVGALAFAQSYQRWADAIIDVGRDLYIPEQLARGAKLYRDIRYQYPPLAPYLLMLLTGVVGHSLASYTVIGIAQSLAIVSGLWLSVRRAVGVFGAFAASLLFVSLSFCGASTYGANFLFPYSYAATFGMAMLTGALASLLYERPRLAIALLVAASWCKVEYAIAAAIVVAGLALTRRLRLRDALAYAGAMGVAFTIAAAYFRDASWLRENVFNAALTKGTIAQQFFAHVAGTFDWQRNATYIVLGVALVVAIALMLRNALVVLALPLALVLGWFAADNHLLVRAFALLQVLALVATARDRSRPLFVFALFSLAATLRIPLNVSPTWYGFVLVVPVYALMAVAMFESRFWPPRRALLWLPVLAVLCGRDLLQQRQSYSYKAYPIVTPRGTLYDWSEVRAFWLQAFVNLPPARSLVVFPEGLTLNYFTKTPTPLSFHTFTPVETADANVEEAILRELIAHPPERVAIVTRDVSEYGSRGFGVDYDRRIAQWLRTHYTLERSGGSPRFQLFVLRR